MQKFSELLRTCPSNAYKVALVLDELCGTKAEFSNSEQLIYTLFFQLEKALPDIFGDFVFEERNVHPFSQEVHDALFDLENAGILGEPNPEYVTYIWKPGREKIRESILTRFDPSTISRVRNAVSKIAPSLGLC